MPVLQPYTGVSSNKDYERKVKQCAFWPNCKHHSMCKYVHAFVDPSKAGICQYALNRVCVNTEETCGYMHLPIPLEAWETISQRCRSLEQAKRYVEKSQGISWNQMVIDQDEHAKDVAYLRKSLPCKDWSHHRCPKKICNLVHAWIQPGKKGICQRFYKRSCTNRRCTYQHLNMPLKEYEALAQGTRSFKELYAKIAARYGWEAANMMTDVHRPAPQVHERKVVQCEHWKTKECFVGSNCLYLHGHVKPGKKGLCINYMKGKCKKGNACVYQHIDIDIMHYERLSEKAKNYEELEKILPRCDDELDADLIREAANVSLKEQTKSTVVIDDPARPLVWKEEEEKKKKMCRENRAVKPGQQGQQQQQQQQPHQQTTLWTNHHPPRMWAAAAAAAPAARRGHSIWDGGGNKAAAAPLSKPPTGATRGVIRSPNLHDMKSQSVVERAPPWSHASFGSRSAAAALAAATGGGGGGSRAPTTSLQPPGFADVKRYSDNSESESSIDDMESIPGGGLLSGGGGGGGGGGDDSHHNVDSSLSSSSSSSIGTEFKRKPLAYWTIGDVKTFIAQCGKAPAWTKYSRIFEAEQVDGATLAMYTSWQPLVDELSIRKNHARVIANLVQSYNNSNAIGFKKEFHEEKRIIGA